MVGYDPENGQIKPSQPAWVRAKTNNAKKDRANGRNSSYTNEASIVPQGENYVHLDLTVDAYRRLIGDFRYLADITRPGLFHVTRKLPAATSKPTERHWMAMKHAIRYRINTPNRIVVFRPWQYLPLTLSLTQDVSDASFAGDKFDRKLTTGVFLTYNTAPVSWNCKKRCGVSVNR